MPAATRLPCPLNGVSVPFLRTSERLVRVALGDEGRALCDRGISGRSLREVAGELGVGYESLRIWVRQDQLDRGERDDGLTTDQLEELRRLRKQVRELEQERDPEASCDFFARETERR